MIVMRQIESDEARGIVESGAVRPPGELLRAAEALHPGGRGGLSLEYGRHADDTARYLFATTVEDEGETVWSVLLDARTGEVVSDEPIQEDDDEDLHEE
ncbi:PepSY domain-containing protein [Streptomyces sp. SID14478]|uniref:PepSY domain-containing protein n=1 Tax=Streptomyces sp. SID14478 TaxID=2706073 RepID=UPI0013DC4B9A|nr:PepSY domain-containing protein [Streptomyces sp. SID14478]NEB75374.1 PepSY domain-containing protein [Streptomyces sp. SID14478]